MPGEKILERKVVPQTIHKENKISEAIIRRENMVLAILLTEGINAYEKLKSTITIDAFKYDINQQILKKLYDGFEKGNSNINSILDTLQDETQLNQITKIMADDYHIQDINKAMIDVIHIYEKEKNIDKRNDILEKLEQSNLTQEERTNLENELNDIIIKLARFK